MKLSNKSRAKTKEPQKHLTFLPMKKICGFNGCATILEVALANEIPLGHSCGGMGSCTTCRVLVVEGAEKLEGRNEVESEHAQMRGYKSIERLACQTPAEDGLVCQLPTDSVDVREEFS